MHNLPETFIQTILATYGERGRRWLNDLPSIIRESQARWALGPLRPYALSFNYVAAGELLYGTPVVLKVGVPDREQESSATAMTLCGGDGMVKLLEYSPELGALLMERILPGEMLSDLSDDDEMTRILVRAGQYIWRPVDSHSSGALISIESYTQALRLFDPGKATRPEIFPPDLASTAQDLLAYLLATQGESLLLHGDLHHDNVLRSGNDWLAIDPKGLLGEREFDLGPMMYNPWQWIFQMPDLEAVLTRRVAILVDEFGFDRQRVIQWCAVEAVLSAIWSYEDGSQNWDQCLPIAEVFFRMMGV